MLGNPHVTQFRFYLPKDWFYPEVVALYNSQTSKFLPFEHVADYINSCLKSMNMPGLTDEGTDYQVEFQKFHTFKGSLDPTQTVEKVISLEYTLKEGYLNWILMYRQALSHYGDNSRDGNFLPQVYLQVMDSSSAIIFEVIYKQVRITSISGLEFSTENTGFQNPTFTLELTFNEFEIKFRTEERINN